MKKYVCSLSALLASVTACKDKEDPFLSLVELCPRRAEELCAARQACQCEPVDENCVTSETESCEALRKAFEAEGGRYASVAAERQRQAQADALFLCEPPLPLGFFFEGPAEDGAACERDTQCASALCDPEAQICAPPAPNELCPAP